MVDVHSLDASPLQQYDFAMIDDNIEPLRFYSTANKKDYLESSLIDELHPVKTTA